MISALQKISTDARIEYIDWKSSTVSSMFIYSPKNNKKSFFSFISNMMSTHPPIEERIELLQKY
jgi:heat shock protein HtpX